MKDLTKEEFIEKYGACEVALSSYFKYTFIFTGTLADGSIVSVKVGGSASAIYSRLITPEPCRVDDIAPYAGSVMRDGVEIADFYTHF